MAVASMQSTKRRIKSIDSTHKITKSMELVSISKLKKTKERFEKNKEYSETLKYCIRNAMAGMEQEDSKETKSDAKMFLVVSSNMGLCGGYNSNLYQQINQFIDKEKDYVVVIGQKAYLYLTKQGYKNVTLYTLDNLDMDTSKEVASLLVTPYQKGEVASVNLLYTTYVNSLTFVPKVEKMLPLEVTNDNKVDDYQVIYEPSKAQLVSLLIPMYINSSVFGALLEAAVSEHASRRTAMEAASDNAEELKDNLLLEYNKARQAAITSEITEVVAGAGSV